LGELLALGVVAGMYCLVTAGASGLITTTTDMSAQARGGGHGGGHGGGGHSGGGHTGAEHSGGGGGGGHAFYGGRGGGHFAGGEREHFWRGHWWRYGIGACWRWTPAEYIWIC
jgi:hypothetical protein